MSINNKTPVYLFMLCVLNCVQTLSVKAAPVIHIHCSLSKTPSNGETKDYYFILDEHRGTVRNNKGVNYKNVSIDNFSIKFQLNDAVFSRDTQRWDTEPNCAKYADGGLNALNELRQVNDDLYQWCSQIAYSHGARAQKRFAIDRLTGGFSFMYWVNERGSIKAVQGYVGGKCEEKRPRF